MPKLKNSNATFWAIFKQFAMVYSVWKSHKRRFLAREFKYLENLFPYKSLIFLNLKKGILHENVHEIFHMMHNFSHQFPIALKDQKWRTTHWKGIENSWWRKNLLNMFAHFQGLPNFLSMKSETLYLQDTKIPDSKHSKWWCLISIFYLNVVSISWILKSNQS